MDVYVYIYTNYMYLYINYVYVYILERCRPSVWKNTVLNHTLRRVLNQLFRVSYY